MAHQIQRAVFASHFSSVRSKLYWGGLQLFLIPANALLWAYEERLVEKILDIGLTVAPQIHWKAGITLLIIPHVHLTLWVRMCMIKPMKLLSSLTFVIITSNIKSSLLLNYIGMFKLNLTLGLKGNRWEGRNYCYLEASDFLTGLRRLVSNWELPVSGTQLALNAVGVETNMK